MRTAPAMYQAGDQPVPGYTLVEPLGKGSFGQVWKATSPGETEVAIKIVGGLDPQRARQEFETLRDAKRFNHPNLTKIFAFWVKDERGEILAEDVVRQMAPPPPPRATEPAFSSASMCETLQALPVETDVETPTVRAPLPGDTESRQHPAQLIIAMGLGDKTLADRLRECRAGKLPEELGGIPADELLRYMDAAARALQYLNVDMKVQHCDIKPQNMLLVSGEAQVCDFSVVKRVAEVSRQTTMTGFTEFYAPPEAFKGEYSNRFDQYSLGVTYTELRTGRLPFESETQAAVYRAKLTGQLDLSKLPPAEQKVIARATALNAEDRFDSITQMVRALHEAVHPPARVHGKPRRRVWDFAVLGGLILAGVSVLLFLVLRSEKKQLGTFNRLMAEGEFAAANNVLSNFSPKKGAALRQKLLPAWRADLLAKLEDTNKARDAFKYLDELLAAAEDDDEIVRRVRDFVSRELRAADDLLNKSAGDAEKDAAKSILGKVGQQLDVIEDDANWKDLRAWNGLSTLRTVAREKEVNWKDIGQKLKRIKADDLPDSPEVRLPYYTLRAAVEADRTDRDLLGNDELRRVCAAASAVQQQFKDEQAAAEQLPWEHELWNILREQLFQEISTRLGSGQLDDQVQWNWENALGDRFRFGVRFAQAKESLQQREFDKVRNHLAEMKRSAGTSISAAASVLLMEVSVELSDPAGAWREAVERLLTDANQLEPRQFAEVGTLLIARLVNDAAAVDGELPSRLGAAWKAAGEGASANIRTVLLDQQQEFAALAALVLPAAQHFAALRPAEAPSSSDRSLLVALVRLERELANTELDSEATRQLAQRVQSLRDSELMRKAPEYFGGYCDYLSVWANRQDRFRLVEGAARLDAAVRQHPWLFRAERAARARGILVGAALEELPTDRAFQVPEELAVDNTAALWIESAAKLPLESDSTLELAQLLVASYSAEPPANDPTMRIGLATQLLHDPQLVEILRTQNRLDIVRLAAAQAHVQRAQAATGEAGAEDGRQAIHHFAAILAARFPWEDESVPGNLEEQLDAWVIQPALAFVELVPQSASSTSSAGSSDSVAADHVQNSNTASGAGGDGAELQKEIAAFFGARGRLLERSVSSKSNDVVRARQEAYATANRYYATARYKTGEGRAVYDDWSLPKPDKAARLQKLADEALALSEQKSAEAWALLGEARHTAALLVCGTDQQEIKRVFTLAREAYDQALSPEGIAAFPARRARWLVFRSAIFVELAHLESHRDRKKELLEKAVSDAQASLGDSHLRMPEEPLNALGNANEDLAWKVYDTPDEKALARQHYLEAIDAFDRAIVKARHTPELAKTLMNAGRSRFRYAAALRAQGAPDNEIVPLLSEARERLEEARAETALSDSPQSGNLRAQTAWLISEVLRLLPADAPVPEGIENPYTNAEKALQDAIAGAQSEGSEHWITYQKTWAKMAVRGGQYEQFVARVEPIINGTGETECNLLTLSSLWDLLASARLFPDRKPLDWVEATVEQFPKNPSDARYSHRLLLEIYRAYYRTILLKPQAERLAQTRRELAELLKSVARLPESSDREILELTSSAAYAICVGQATTADELPAIHARLTEGCQRLDALVQRLDRPGATDLLDVSMDSEIRKRLGEYTKFFLVGFSGPRADRLPAQHQGLRLNAAAAKRLEETAIRALEPMLSNPAVSPNEKSEIQTLIDSILRAGG